MRPPTEAASDRLDIRVARILLLLLLLVEELEDAFSLLRPTTEAASKAHKANK